MLNIAIEEIAMACASTALILMIQELGTLPIKLFGSDELQGPPPASLRERRMVAGVCALQSRTRAPIRPACSRARSSSATSG